MDQSVHVHGVDLGRPHPGAASPNPRAIIQVRGTPSPGLFGLDRTRAMPRARLVHEYVRSPCRRFAARLAGRRQSRLIVGEHAGAQRTRRCSARSATYSRGERKVVPKQTWSCPSTTNQGTCGTKDDEGAPPAQRVRSASHSPVVTWRPRKTGLLGVIVPAVSEAEHPAGRSRVGPAAE